MSYPANSMNPMVSQLKTKLWHSRALASLSLFKKFLNYLVRHYQLPFLISLENLCRSVQIFCCPGKRAIGFLPKWRQILQILPMYLIYFAFVWRTTLFFFFFFLGGGGRWRNLSSQKMEWSYLMQSWYGFWEKSGRASSWNIYEWFSSCWLWDIKMLT